MRDIYCDWIRDLLEVLPLLPVLVYGIIRYAHLPLKASSQTQTGHIGINTFGYKTVHKIPKDKVIATWPKVTAPKFNAHANQII